MICPKDWEKKFPERFDNFDEKPDTLILDHIYIRKENLEYFYKIHIFWPTPTASKHVITSDVFNIIWLFTNPALNKLGRPEKSSFKGDLFF